MEELSSETMTANCGASPRYVIVAEDAAGNMVPRWCHEFDSMEEAYLLFSHWYLTIDFARQVPEDPLYADAVRVARFYVEVCYHE